MEKKTLEVPGDIKTLVLEFANKAKRFKKTKEFFDESKEYFEQVVGEYFDENHIDDDGLRIDYPSDELGPGSSITVKRIQKKTVLFDPDKVEEVIKRKVAGDGYILVVEKQYKISDIGGLVAYMRSLGADPSIFKTFISVDKSVKQEGLDQMEQLGIITHNDLKGCYTVKKAKPYFQLKFDKLPEEGW